MLGKIIAKNIKFSAINKAINMLYSLIFFPFIIHYVGKEVYGIYLLVLTIAGYLSLLDLGVGSAVVKYVAEYNGRDDAERTNAIINFSFTFFVCISAIIALMLFVMSFFFDSLFKVSDINRQIARQLFWVAGITALIYWPNFLFRNVLMGLQRYDWSSAGDVLIVAVNAIAAYIVFPRGGTIVTFQIIALFAIMGVLLLYLIKIYTFLPRFKLSFPYFDAGVYKTVFSYSVFFFLSGIVGMFIFQIGHVVAGIFLSVSAVTLYGVAFSMQQNIRSINAIIGSPFVPAAAELHSQDRLDDQRNLFLQGTRYSTAFFFPIIIISIVFARDFIIKWMGPSFSDSVLPAQLLLCFWFFSGSMDIGANILYGKGIVNVFFWATVICAIFTVSLTLALVRVFGIAGIALGITLPMIFINFPLCLYFVLKNLKIPLKDFYRRIIQSNLFLYIIVAVTAVIINRIYVPHNIFLVILEMALIYLACLTLYYFAIADKEDRARIRQVVVS